AVACNEAVELAHRYSDEPGRRMINGVLGRFTAARV
ncbi:MAG: transcription antitermination factor NusB, partial [Cyanobacteriota bacterium]